MEVQISFDEIKDMILDKYYEIMDASRINLNIELVEDIYARRLELEDHEELRKSIGTIVLPKTIDGVYTILISNKAITNLRFIGTICHELTHIHDYIDFANEYCGCNLELIYSHELQGIFFLWTEFHARCLGYLFYRTAFYALNNITLTKEEQIQHIKTAEYQLHYKTLYDDIWKAYENNNNTYYLYSIVNYLGRVSAWGIIFKDEFNLDNFIPDYLVNQYGNRIFDFFHLLQVMKNFQLAKDKLKELDQIVNSFCGDNKNG